MCEADHRCVEGLGTSTLSVDTDGFDEAHLALHAPSEPPLLPTDVPLHEVAVGAVNIHEHLHQRLWQPRGINVSVEPLVYEPPSLAGIHRLAGHLVRGEVVPGCTTAEQLAYVG